MIKVDIKNRIKEALEIREITQTELAEKANIDKGQLSSYISGKYKPRQNNIDALATALNVNEAWLMGFNVPMERNDYEDQTIITFDAKLDAAQYLIIDAGYQISLSDDGIITITTSNHEIICSMREYELVNIYESLIKRKKLSAHALLEEISNGWKKIDSCLTGKEASEDVYSRLEKNIEKFYGKKKELNDIYDQLSSGNQDKVLQYSKNLLSNQKMEEELAAAHERTDIEVTDQMRKHDDDIMMDDSEWK